MTQVRTIPELKLKKQAGEPITMLTCYDATMARLLAQAGVDSVLVGDSLGMVVQGEESTLPVSLEEMVYHTRCVARGLQQVESASRPLLIADLPFMSYQASPRDALLSAGALLKAGHAQAVKLEGGESLVPTVKALVAAGIPVVGHIGLQPQSVHMMGGYRIQGREGTEAKRLQAEAHALSAAGCAALVIEGIPSEVAREITASIPIPTIGIGSGVYCDGQVLVVNDMLEMDSRFQPRFVRRYAHLEQTILDAVRRFNDDVKARIFPSEAESFSVNK